MKNYDCADSSGTFAGFDSHNEAALISAFEMDSAVHSANTFTDLRKICELNSEDDVAEDKQKGAKNDIGNRFSGFESSLELDLEFQALTIISSSQNMKDYFNKYNQCYSLILPLAYSNKTVMFTFAGWLMSINQLPVAEKFLNRSTKLFESTESKLLSGSKDFAGDITGVIVSRTYSDIYKKYDNMKRHFHSWFQMKVGVLERKICQTAPNLNIQGLTDDQKNKLDLFHDILKKSLRVFLKVRILGCSTANLQVKLLCEEIMSGIHNLISWELNNYLLFPFLIAGTSVYEKVDKLRLQKLYCELRTYLKSGNLEKVWEMIQHVWDSYAGRDEDQNAGDLLSVIDCDVCVF
ncbi:hypothetical protein PMKS-000087 [Pichia membranifaciens]|uniref:Uncharacterized protein n=1 Tax=Pichia membranifaciens TaxID=4926 RepID=A0A1Q2YB29_9ASCO|nr:hypothetical protein PMKS-000087 [Pichia membranifaciens]